MAEPYVCINSHASFMSPPRAPAAPLPIHQTAQAVMSSSNKPPFIFPSHQPLLLPLLLTFTHSSPFSLLPPFFFSLPLLSPHLSPSCSLPSPPSLQALIDLIFVFLSQSCVVVPANYTHCFSAYFTFTFRLLAVFFVISQCTDCGNTFCLFKDAQ